MSWSFAQQGWIGGKLCPQWAEINGSRILERDFSPFSVWITKSRTLTYYGIRHFSCCQEYQLTTMQAQNIYKRFTKEPSQAMTMYKWYMYVYVMYMSCPLCIHLQCNGFGRCAEVVGHCIQAAPKPGSKKPWTANFLSLKINNSAIHSEILCYMILWTNVSKVSVINQQMTSASTNTKFPVPIVQENPALRLIHRKENAVLASKPWSHTNWSKRNHMGDYHCQTVKLKKVQLSRSSANI